MKSYNHRALVTLLKISFNESLVSSRPQSYNFEGKRPPMRKPKDQLGLAGPLDLARPHSINQMEQNTKGIRPFMTKPKNQLGFEAGPNSHFGTLTSDVSKPIGPRSAMLKPRDTLLLTGNMDLSKTEK